MEQEGARAGPCVAAMIFGMGEQARANGVAWVRPSVHESDDGGGRSISAVLGGRVRERK